MGKLFFNVYFGGGGTSGLSAQGHDAAQLNSFIWPGYIRTLPRTSILKKLENSGLFRGKVNYFSKNWRKIFGAFGTSGSSRPFNYAATKALAQDLFVFNFRSIKKLIKDYMLLIFFFWQIKKMFEEVELQLKEEREKEEFNEQVILHFSSNSSPIFHPCILFFTPYFSLRPQIKKRIKEEIKLLRAELATKDELLQQLNCECRDLKKELVKLQKRDEKTTSLNNTLLNQQVRYLKFWGRSAPRNGTLPFFFRRGWIFEIFGARIITRQSWKPKGRKGITSKACWKMFGGDFLWKKLRVSKTVSIWPGKSFIFRKRVTMKFEK